MLQTKRLGVIVLTNTTNNSVQSLTSNCLKSLYESEKDNDNVVIDTLVIESNKNFDTTPYTINEHIASITPPFAFNFHKFLNIGITHFRKTHDFIALCNNDLIFKKSWFSEILKVNEKYSHIWSFSPFDDEKKKIPPPNKISLGYGVREHIAGWCIVAHPKVFDRIGLLDEGFDFYYADDEYAMMLRKYNIANALVYPSHVVHLERQNTREIKNEKTNFFPDEIAIKSLPAYIHRDGYNWLLKNKKALEGHLKFHAKWGSPKQIVLKNRISKVLVNLGLGFLTRYIY
jgi:GT2 family glycosyltransferase